MNRRPLVASTAAVSALLLCAAAGTAAAGTTTVTKPAAGAASSALSLLTASAGGHVVRVGDLTLLSDTLGGSPLAKVVVTPLTADGTAYGQQVVTPDSSPTDIPALSSPAALAGILSLNSPAFTTSASKAPSAHAGAASLGTLSLLGIPVPVAGSVDLGSAVSSTTGALGSKTVTVQNLALPSIAQILAALGLDLSKLPVTTLDQLVTQLGLVTPVVSAAQAAVSTALAQVAAAQAAVTSATSALTAATQGQSAAQAALAGAAPALQAVINQVPALSLPAGAGSVAGFTALPAALQSSLAGLVPGGTAALSAYDAAQTALTAAQGVVTTAQGVLATAQAALAGLIATLQSTLAPLQALLTTVLGTTPLVSLDALSVTSRAVVTSNKAGGQEAQVLGGSLTGLHVLGTDVLKNVLGSSSVNLVDLVGSTAGAVTSTISGLTSTLSTVLSTVPGLPALSIPAPKIDLLTKTSSTSISTGFGRAATAVQGLKITLPAVTLPTSVTLPGAASLPALSGVTQVTGLLSSAPVSLGLLTLSDQAAFRPAVLAATPTTPVPPTTPTPTTPGVGLPNTGLPGGLAVVSLVLLGAALVLRRRRTAVA